MGNEKMRSLQKVTEKIYNIAEGQLVVGGVGEGG